MAPPAEVRNLEGSKCLTKTNGPDRDRNRGFPPASSLKKTCSAVVVSFSVLENVLEGVQFDICFVLTPSERPWAATTEM